MRGIGLQNLDYNNVQPLSPKVLPLLLVMRLTMLVNIVILVWQSVTSSRLSRPLPVKSKLENVSGRLPQTGRTKMGSGSRVLGDLGFRVLGFRVQGFNGEGGAVHRQDFT